MLQALRLHPDSRCDAVSRIEASLSNPRPGQLQLRYRVSGNIGGLLLPTPGIAKRADELWRHTCFEAFLQAEAPAYVECNFSASRQWAAYAFDGYRSGMRNAGVSIAPLIETKFSKHELDIKVLLDGLSIGKQWRIGLSAVIEETDGRKSYWALAHPPGKPDFHHADGFALELP